MVFHRFGWTVWERGWLLPMYTFVAIAIVQIRKAWKWKHVLQFFLMGVFLHSLHLFKSWTGAQISEQSSRDACCLRTFPSFNCSASWYGSFKSPWQCSHHLLRPVACSITWWQMFTIHHNSYWTSLHACALWKPSCFCDVLCCRVHMVLDVVVCKGQHTRMYCK